jgi:hypothetical protein
MKFREWVQILEAGGLFANPGVPYEGGSPLHPNNCDMYLSKHCGGGAGGAGGIGAGIPKTGAGGLFAGSGPGLGGQVPKRMKKMPKK